MVAHVQINLANVYDMNAIEQLKKHPICIAKQFTQMLYLFDGLFRASKRKKKKGKKEM